MLPIGADNLRPPYLEAAEELRDNPEQWQAYGANGNCVILAGPGSGKTKTLTIKMARMLAEDIRPPRGIACITYSTECARELKRRLDRLGVDEGPNTFIGTVHAFCLKHVLLPYAKLAGLNVPDPLSIASESEQDEIYYRACSRIFGEDRPPSGWKTKVECYRRTYLDRTAPEWRNTNEQIAEFIEFYEAMLRGKGLIDFDDMVLSGLKLIEGKEWVRKALRSRFPILVVDEYQDLGLPLHRIVRSLCLDGGVRLLAVGDPDQSIYGFAGAKPELLRELEETDGIEVVRLRFNYRSGKTIIDISQVALGENRDYQAKKGHAGTLYFHECPAGLEEQAELICRAIIPEALRRGPDRKLGEVAVLYMDRNDGDIIARHVTASTAMKFIRIDRGAPYRKTPLIQWLEDCAAWCSGGWFSGKPRLSTLLRAWKAFNRSVQLESELRLIQASLVRFLFSHRAPDAVLRTWLSDFETSCLRSCLDRDSTLRDEAEAFQQLVNACAEGRQIENFTVATFAGQGGSPDHLNLITLHSAKGREFDVVVMMGMDQGKIPSWAATSEEGKREPRRLFYVGMTRARYEIHFTYSGWTENRWGRRFDNGPSEFLIEIQRKLAENEGSSV